MARAMELMPLRRRSSSPCIAPVMRVSSCPSRMDMMARFILLIGSTISLMMLKANTRLMMNPVSTTMSDTAVSW